MIETIKELYPIESCNYIARILNISPWAVYCKGLELGLKKTTKRRFIENEESVKALYPTNSCREIAEIIGIHTTTVKRIVARLGLKRTPEEDYEIRSRIRKSLVRKEYRRILFGLEQTSKIKVVKNPKKYNLRYKLKKHGYKCDWAGNVIYFSSDIKRYPKWEQEAVAIGFRIEPENSEQLIG